MLDEFFPDSEITNREVFLALDESEQFLASRENQAAAKIVATIAPQINCQNYVRIKSLRREILSDFGYGADMALAIMSPDMMADIAGFEKHILRMPVCFRHLATWALYFAARKVSNAMQVKHCKSPTSESHLSGMLIGALGEACETWTRPVESALKRFGQALVIHRVDLSILGGEQATGGDFAIILDFEPGSVAKHQRIVPIIFQAKRYNRPHVDISQHHHARGYQRHVLSHNKCDAAFIFYENDAKGLLPQPLPPLVKSIKAIRDANRTNALEESVDFATYLTAALYDPEVSSAASANEALRMIYSNASHDQLAFVAVISGSRGDAVMYDYTLQSLAPEILGQGGEEQHIDNSIF